MQIQPLISIIIPTYNRAHLLDETLDSVLAQTYQNWECLVVDDGSTDDTKALLKDYTERDSRFQYRERPDTHLPGGNGARNYGFEVSKGEYVQWFDDDDVMLPEFLSSKLAGFITQAVEFVICTGYTSDVNLEKQTFISLSPSHNLYKDYAQIKFIALTPSILFKKSYLKGNHLFDETLVRGQEMDFFLRLFYFKTAEQYQIMNKGLFLYRQHDKTKTVGDQAYNPLYKDSQTRIYIANLERSVTLKDKDLIIMFYRSLLNYFFAGLNHKHYTNSTLILKNLPRIMGVVSKKLQFELRLLCAVCMFFKHPFYRFHLRLKYHPALQEL